MSAMWVDIKGLLKHSGVYLLGNVLNRVGAFLLLPLYTRYLSVGTYGALEMLYATTAIVSTVWAGGLAHTTVRFYFDAPEGEARDRVVVTNLAMSLVLALTGCGLLIMFRHVVAEWVFGDSGGSFAILLCAFIVLFELTTEVGFAYLRARNLSWFFVGLSAAKLIVQVSLCIHFVVVLDWGINGVLSANLASVLLVWLVTIGYVLRNCGFAIDRSRVAAILSYSLPFGMSSIVAAVMSNVDRFLLKAMMSVEAVGIYALSVKFSQLLVLLLSEPFYRGYGPFRFSIIEKENAKAIQAMVAEYVVVAATIIGVGIAAFTPEVLSVMAAEEFIPAYHYVPILALGIAVGTLSYCFETGILYRKKTKYILYISFADLAAKVLLNFAFIPVFGIYGAAFAFALSALLHIALIAKVSDSLYPVRYPYGRMVLTLIVGVVAYCLTLLLDYRELMTSIPGKLVVVIALISILMLINRDMRQLIGKRLKIFRD